MVRGLHLFLLGVSLLLVLFTAVDPLVLLLGAALVGVLFHRKEPVQ